MRRFVGAVSVSGVMSFGVAFSGAAFATPATPGSISASCSGATTVLTATSVTGYAGDTITLTASSGDVVDFIRTGSNVVTWSGGATQRITGPASLTATLGSTSGSFYVSGTNTCSASTITVAVTIIPGANPNTDSATSTPAPAPVLETLTLEVSSGSTTCTGGSPTGYTGSWLQLPAADACSQSGPNANPNAKLLGWATDPIFPVAVAKEIVDLKYGPIDDYFYGMRMIFIPAGGWTYISSSNNLYPIWSS